MGYFQSVGVLNLSYSGQKYHLKEGVVHFNLDEKPWVDAPSQYADRVLHLNLDHGDQEMKPFDKADIDKHSVGLIMAHQYTLKKGLELFCEKAVIKELKQIHDIDTYTPIDDKILSKEDKNKALSALFFLAEKRDGRIEGRKCTVGSKQRKFEGHNKVDGTSHTVSEDGILITATIDVTKNVMLPLWISQVHFFR